MTTWEYAFLNLSTGQAWRCTVEGDERILDNGPSRGWGVDEITSRLATEMGIDGWELTTSVNGVLWFKRPTHQ